MKTAYKNIYNYLNETIRPIYNSFDGAHNLKHYDEVFNATQMIAENSHFCEWERAILAISAAYHDIGRCISNDDHEIYSSTIFKNDANMKHWLTYLEIDMISDMIVQHRTNHEITIEYVKILRDADKICCMDRNRLMERVVSNNYTKYGKEGINSVVARSFAKFSEMEANNKNDTWWSIEAQNLYGDKPEIRHPSVDELMTYAYKYEIELMGE